jgi:DNA-binding NarL/FixJ family response regulator
LSAGAAGYVLKGVSGDRLINAINRTLEGESPLNQELAAQLLRRLADKSGEEAQPPPQPQRREDQSAHALTPRENEVLGLLARGQYNPEIAQTLTISRSTVKVHVERIIRKLEVSDRTQAAIRGIELGIFPSEGW